MSRIPINHQNQDDHRIQQKQQKQQKRSSTKNNHNNSTHQKDGIFLKKSGASLAEEDDEGAVEYKWRLVGITEQRLNHLVTQMKFRVAEGRGECIYEIGVEDDGYTRGLPQAEFDESIATLRTMAARLGFTLSINCVVSKTNPKDPKEVLKCAEVRVRKIVQTLPTCRIAVIGDTNSGKSTLVGVVAAGELDDGGGTVRQRVFNHKHELQSGQTSSVCDRVVGFGSDGKIVNYHNATNDTTSKNHSNDQTSDDSSKATNKTDDDTEQFQHANNQHNDGGGDTDTIAERAATLTLLMDLPGHLKRSHTALSALVGRFPHVVCLVINPNDLSCTATNLSSTTSTAAASPVTASESNTTAAAASPVVSNGSFSHLTSSRTISLHIAQCAALQVPFFVVFTHQDSTPPLVLGQAAAHVDRAIGEETGKRLVMVSSPIFPGEGEGGFYGREMIHTSSDMFLSDLGSNTDQNQNNNNNKTPGAKSANTNKKQHQQSKSKNSKSKSKATKKQQEHACSDIFMNSDMASSDASPILKSDLDDEEENNSGSNRDNTSRNSNDNDSDAIDSENEDANAFPSSYRPSRNPVEMYLEKNVPVFIVSSVTGYGIPFFKHFLHQLSLSPPRLTVDECEEEVNNNAGTISPVMTSTSVPDLPPPAPATATSLDEPSGMLPPPATSHTKSGTATAMTKTATTTSGSSIDNTRTSSTNKDDEDENNDHDEDNNNTQNTTNSSSLVTSPVSPTASQSQTSHHITSSNINHNNKWSRPNPNNNPNNIRVPTVRFVVDKVYNNVAKVGLVVAGTVTSGTIQVGQYLYWGPSKQGTFFQVQVASLHYQRNFVRSVGSGNECAVAFEGGDNLSQDLQVMSQTRRGTLLYGSGFKDTQPPSTSRDFRVLLAKQHAVTTAQTDFRVDMELTAFVFSAKQTVFLKSIDPVDFSSEEYAMVRAQRSVGDAQTPLILQCSFVYQPEVLAVGAPIVLLRNTPDGRLGACVAGRILSFVVATDASGGAANNNIEQQSSNNNLLVHAISSHNTLSSGKSSNDASKMDLDTIHNNQHQKRLNKKARNNKKEDGRGSSASSPRSTCPSRGDSTVSLSSSASHRSTQNSTTANVVGQFPENVSVPISNEAAGMTKPQTSSPPLTPTTSPPPPTAPTISSSSEQQQQQQQIINTAAELKVAQERAERKKLKKKEGAY